MSVTAQQPEATEADIVGPDGVVYPDFSGAGIPGGIPKVPVVAIAADFGAIPNDGQDDSKAIQAAIEFAAAQGGGAVLIPEGRFIIDQTIHVNNSRIVVRGADRSRTVLVPRFHGKSPMYTRGGDGPARDKVIVFEQKINSLRYSVSLDQPVHRGQTVIPVPDAQRYRVGQVVVLTAMPPADVIGQLSAEGRQHIERGTWGAIYSHQHLRIAEILEDAIRTTKPVRLDLAVSQKPKLTRVELLVGCGLENLTIRQDLANQGISGVFFNNTARCWMRGVNIFHIGNWPAGWDRSFEYEMRDCHFDRSRSLGGSLAYIGFGFATDGLIEDCRITRFRHLSISMASNGNVFRQCFFENVDVNFHMHWPYENLFENCHIDASMGPNATDQTVGHGSYGHGFYLPDHAGGGHNPAGPRNTFYGNKFIAAEAGMILGGGGAKRTIVAYNLFQVKRGVAAIVKPGSDHTLVKGNVFVLHDPNRRPGGNIYGIDNPGQLIGGVMFPEQVSPGIRFTDNRFYGAPQGKLFAGGEPDVSLNNQALANWNRKPGGAPLGTVSLAGPWRAIMVRKLQRAPTPDKRHEDPGISDQARKWLAVNVDDSDWTTMDMPTAFGHESVDFQAHDGEAVIRRHFDLPAELMGRAMTLSLGPIDDHDQTWVNGRKIGGVTGPNAWKTPSSYQVPADLLKPKDNVIAIRIWDAFGGGGMSGIPEDMWIGRPQAVGGDHLPGVIPTPTPPVPSLYDWPKQRNP